MKEEYILKLVQIQNQFRFLHWQTTFDAKHKAYGDIYEGLGVLIDDFVEAMMGKYGRPEFPAEFSIMFQDINKLSRFLLLEYLFYFIAMLCFALLFGFDICFCYLLFALLLLCS